MKFFDICTRKFFEKEGETKIKWYRAGVMKETDKGTRFIRFFNQPETDFFVFDKIEQPKEDEGNK